MWLCAALLAPAFGSAGFSRATETKPEPLHRAEKAVTISTGISSRVLEQDEVWTADFARFQLLDGGQASRTITLPVVGGDGVTPGSTLVARVQTHDGRRVLFRGAEGQLVGFCGGAGAANQWIELHARESGWHAETSSGRTIYYDDPAFAWLGATPAPRADDPMRLYVMPEHPRTDGFAIRFDTDAPRFVIVCRANSPRFRVLANDEVIADVDIPGRSGETLFIPIELGTAARRHVEIFADDLEFRSIEVTNAQHSVYAWAGAVPAVRVLWLGDYTTGGGTHGYPWQAAREWNCDLWNRRWSDISTAISARQAPAVPVDRLRSEITEVDPDVVVLAGNFFDAALKPDDYRAQVATWLDAINQSARPETVKIVLPQMCTSATIDRHTDRRAGLVQKEAKRRGFNFVNWQLWIGEAQIGRADRGLPALASIDGTLSSEGIALVASRFAAGMRRVDVEERAQIASLKRRGASVADKLAVAE